jgi:hypothetical protein
VLKEGGRTAWHYIHRLAGGWGDGDFLKPPFVHCAVINSNATALPFSFSSQSVQFTKPAAQRLEAKLPPIPTPASLMLMYKSSHHLSSHLITHTLSMILYYTKLVLITSLYASDDLFHACFCSCPSAAPQAYP